MNQKVLSKDPSTINYLVLLVLKEIFRIESYDLQSAEKL